MAFSLQAILGRDLSDAVLVVDNAKSPVAPVSMQIKRQSSMDDFFAEGDNNNNNHHSTTTSGSTQQRPHQRYTMMKRQSSMDDIFAERTLSTTTTAATTSSVSLSSSQQPRLPTRHRRATPELRMPVRMVSPVNEAAGRPVMLDLTPAYLPTLVLIE